MLGLVDLLPAHQLSEPIDPSQLEPEARVTSRARALVQALAIDRRAWEDPSSALWRGDLGEPPVLGVLPDDRWALCWLGRVAVERYTPGEPVGLQEISQRLGVRRQTVDMWRHRKIMPEPRWRVGGRPAWRWIDIYTWNLERRDVRPLPA